MTSSDKPDHEVIIYGKDITNIITTNKYKITNNYTLKEAIKQCIQCDHKEDTFYSYEPIVSINDNIDNTDNKRVKRY